MLRIIAGVALLAAVASPPGAAAGSEPLRPTSVTFSIGQNAYTVDGKTQVMDAAPFIENGRTYVPVRYLAAAVGVAPGEIHWVGDTQQVQLRLGGIRIQLQVGSRSLQVGDAVINLDVAPLLRDGRVYLPARWVAQAFGYRVLWDAANSAVVLTAIRTLRLATLSPLSEGATTLGTDVSRGAGLAVADYQDRFRPYGFALEWAAYDDKGHADVGATQAALIDADPAVIGVVGPLNSGVTRAAAPALAGDHLVMVSPANTSASVTSQGWTHFDRLLANDDRQGPAAAHFAGLLGAKSAYLLSNGDQAGTYTANLVKGFSSEAGSAGIAVLGTAVATAGDQALDEKLAAVVAAQPDLVFYAGFANDGGPIFKALRARGFSGLFLGGDAFDDPALAQLVGDAALGVYMVEALPPQDSLGTSASQQSFRTAFLQQYNRLPTVYAYMAYDAAALILNAALSWLQANPGQVPARADIAAAVRATRGFQGIAGEVAFDSHGDNLAARMWLYQLNHASFQAVTSLPATP